MNELLTDEDIRLLWRLQVAGQLYVPRDPNQPFADRDALNRLAKDPKLVAAVPDGEYTMFVPLLPYAPSIHVRVQRYEIENYGDARPGGKGSGGGPKL